MSEDTRRQNTSSTADSSGVPNESTDAGLNNNFAERKCANDRKDRIMWDYVIAIGALHLGAICGAYLLFSSINNFTIVFGKHWRLQALKCESQNCYEDVSNLIYFCFVASILCVISGLGITACAHRLCSHRAYKVKLSLRVLLAAFQAVSFQFPIIDWARDHRLHPECSDTDADPHNPTWYWTTKSRITLYYSMLSSAPDLSYKFPPFLRFHSIVRAIIHVW